MKKYGLEQKKRRKIKIFTTDSNHKFLKYPNLIKEIIPLFPNHIWASDITFIKLRNGAFCYLAAIIDVFTRNVRGWSLKNTLETELVLEALTKALKKGTPLYHTFRQRKTVLLSGIHKQTKRKRSSNQHVGQRRADSKSFRRIVFQNIKS